MLQRLNREAIVAPRKFNRWLIPPAALAIHLCIGQVYGFSVFKIPLRTWFDTGEVAVAWIFSLGIAMLGISAAIGGRWVERVGPRKSMALAGSCWVAGFLISVVGINAGQLWLVYLGYGFVGGIGLGIGYISPVSTLIKWFPDRPGMATGLAIMGFGGGALIASPLSNRLMVFFGGGDDPAQLADGVALTFLTLALIYAVIITLGAFVIRVPHPDWRPAGYEPEKSSGTKMRTSANVAAKSAFRTPQFWLLWIVLFTNVTAGIGILENASPMIQDYFPAVTAATAAGFVGALSLLNMGGRFVWSATSDFTGRKPIYVLYLGAGILLYLTLATVGQNSMMLFIVAAMIILSFYGGGFATIPAYLKDLFGSYQVGAIHGGLLTAWSAAGIAGPLIVNVVLERRQDAGASGAALYTPSMFLMIGVLAIGFIANMFVRPVDPKHHLPTESTTPSATPSETRV